jgi:hypothetical protein
MTVPKSYGERVLEAREKCREVFARMEKGETVDFEVLRGLPGVRMEGDPTTWEDMVKIVQDGSEEALGSLGRTPMEIRKYFDSRKVRVLFFSCCQLAVACQCCTVVANPKLASLL